MAAICRLNGDQGLTDLDDVQISDLIEQRVPQNTYQSIDVETIDYVFSGDVNPLRTRKIILKRATLSAWGESVTALFTAIFSNAEGIRKYQEVTNFNVIKNYVLGVSNSQLDAAEVQKAYLQCKTIIIHIDNECRYAEIAMKETSGIIKNIGTISGLSQFVLNSLTLFGNAQRQ